MNRPDVSTGDNGGGLLSVSNDQAFRLLDGLLACSPVHVDNADVDGEVRFADGDAEVRFAGAAEFMLMRQDRSESGELVTIAFKHVETRNYVRVELEWGDDDNGSVAAVAALVVPRTAEPFHRGAFGPSPADLERATAALKSLRLPSLRQQEHLDGMADRGGATS